MNEDYEKDVDELNPRLTDLKWGAIFWIAVIALACRFAGLWPFMTEAVCIATGTAFLIRCLADEGWDENALIAIGYSAATLVCYRACSFGLVGWWLLAAALAVGLSAYLAMKIFERWLDALATESEEMEES